MRLEADLLSLGNTLDWYLDTDIIAASLSLLEVSLASVSLLTQLFCPS